MKRYFPALVLTSVLVLVLGAARTLNQVDDHRPGAPNVQGTGQYGWTELCHINDTNSTPLTASTKKWSDIQQGFVEIPQTWNTISLAAYAHGDGTTDANDPNGGSFSWKIFVCQKYGVAQLVAYGTWAVGELELSCNPENGVALSTSETNKFCELPVLTASYWPLEVDVSGTTDDVGQISFDPLGAYGIYMEMTSKSDVNDVVFIYTGR